MIRKNGWEGLLDEFFQANLSRSFQWGEWDCGLFAAGAIQAMTGEDLASEYRGNYSSALEAAHFGGAERIAELAGLDEILVGFAGRGDLVLLANDPHDPCLGILGLDGRAVMVTGSGLAWVDREKVLRAWKV